MLNSGQDAFERRLNWWKLEVLAKIIDLFLTSCDVVLENF